MPANTTPIFTRVGDVSTDGGTGMAQGVTAAANDTNGTSANNVLVFTADATNGSFLDRIRCVPKGTNVATVARVFINNGADPTVATNNEFVDNITLPATTLSATSAMPVHDQPMRVALPPGFRVYVGLATAVAAGWVFSPFGGKY